MHDGTAIYMFFDSLRRSKWKVTLFCYEKRAEEIDKGLNRETKLKQLGRIQLRDQTQRV